MSNEKPIIAGDASKAATPATPAAPQTTVADKDKAAKMTAEPTAKPVDAAKKS